MDQLNKQKSNEDADNIPNVESMDSSSDDNSDALSKTEALGPEHVLPSPPPFDGDNNDTSPPLDKDGQDNLAPYPPPKEKDEPVPLPPPEEKDEPVPLPPQNDQEEPVPSPPPTNEPDKPVPSSTFEEKDDNSDRKEDIPTNEAFNLNEQPTSPGSDKEIQLVNIPEQGHFNQDSLAELCQLQLIPFEEFYAIMLEQYLTVEDMIELRHFALNQKHSPFLFCLKLEALYPSTVEEHKKYLNLLEVADEAVIDDVKGDSNCGYYALLQGSWNNYLEHDDKQMEDILDNPD